MRRVTLVAGLAGCVLGEGGEAPPVNLEVGAPTPIGFDTRDIGADGVRGVVDHEICVAVDVTEGFVKPTQLIDTGQVGPANGAAVQFTPLADLACPTGDGWKGWARIDWGTVTGRALVTFDHTLNPGLTDPDDDDVPFEIDAGFFELAPTLIRSGGEVLLEGERFAGYQITAETIEDGGASVKLQVGSAYRATATLASRPAQLDLVLTFSPETPAVVGGSPGFTVDDATGAIVLPTDVDGEAYLLLDAFSFCDAEYVLFAQTPDGGTELVTTLSCL
jgi:hypothetical protein